MKGNMGFKGSNLAKCCFAMGLFVSLNSAPVVLFATNSEMSVEVSDMEAMNSPSFLNTFKWGELNSELAVRAVAFWQSDSSTVAPTSPCAKLTSSDKDSTAAKPTPIDELVMVLVEEMPEYPGGVMALNQWIMQNVKVPFEAKQNNIRGKVWVSFIIEKDGKVTNHKVAKGVNPIIDQAALEAVQQMPDWKPGKEAGKPVRVKYTVPINFDYK